MDKEIKLERKIKSKDSHMYKETEKEDREIYR